MGVAMTQAEVDDLPVLVNLTTSAKVLGRGRDWAYLALRSGTFPCRTVQVGRNRMVPRAELLRVLGADSVTPAAAQEIDARVVIRAVLAADPDAGVSAVRRALVAARANVSDAEMRAAYAEVVAESTEKKAG